MLERSDHSVLPEDHTVTMEVAGFAPLLSQWRAPSQSGVAVTRVWPSLDVAMVWPFLPGSSVMVFMETGLSWPGSGRSLWLWVATSGIKPSYRLMPIIKLRIPGTRLR